MLTQINAVVWNYILLPITLLSAVILTIKCRFFQFTKPIKIFKTAFSQSDTKSGVSPFGAMCTALSGTMGIGNVAGVGTALALGGAGAIFWMVVSAFLCMAIKFGEVAMAVEHRTPSENGWRGGLMYVIESVAPRFRAVGIAFAVVTVVASVGTGGISQSGAAATGMQSAFGISKWLTGVLIGAVCLWLILAPSGLIAKLSAVAVPICGGIYLVGCGAVLFLRSSEILPSVSQILSGFGNAFSISGGVSGFAVSRAVQYGVSRGIFTNESGMGSSPIVHSEAAANPLKQGCFGILEVFFDTVVMCPITALCILATGSDRLCGVSPVNYTMSAFNCVFGQTGSGFVAVASLFFAVGAAVGWSFYGKRASEYLGLPTKIYAVIFCVVTAVGATLPEMQLFEIADLFNAMMMLPNLCVLICCANQVSLIAKRLK